MADTPGWPHRAKKANTAPRMDMDTQRCIRLGQHDRVQAHRQNNDALHSCSRGDGISSISSALRYITKSPRHKDGITKKPPSQGRGPETKPGRQSEDDRTPRGIIRISSVGLSGDSGALNNDTPENERCQKPEALFWRNDSRQQPPRTLIPTPKHQSYIRTLLPKNRKNLATYSASSRGSWIFLSELFSPKSDLIRFLNPLSQIDEQNLGSTVD